MGNLSMDAAYLNRLSDDIKSVVKQVEASIGFPIEVVIDAPSGSMSCALDQHRATIFSRSVEYLQDGPVLHEVLHIRRILVDGIPRLTDCEDCNSVTPQMVTALAKLDNGIEHLAIVPEEIVLRPDRRAYWEERTSRALRELERGSPTVDDAKRQILLLSLFLRFVLAGSPHGDALVRLEERYGLRDKARRFADRVASVLPSKEGTVLEVFAALELPTEIAAFEYIDPGPPRTTTRPLREFS